MHSQQQPQDAPRLRASDAVPAVLPALVLTLFLFHSGTFFNGASWLAGSVGYGVVIALSAWAALHTSDPLGLGRCRVFAVLLWLSVLTSMLLSPVERAGRVAVVLLPFLLFLPAAVALCLGNAQRRALGIRSLVVVLFLVSTAAWLELWRFGGPRLAMPLGHHNLLALTLLALLPLSAVAGLTGTRLRAFSLSVGAIGAATLIATRSLAGSLGLMLIAVTLVALRLDDRRMRRAAVGVLLVVLAVGVAVQGRRLAAIAGGDDRSANVRLEYARAAVDGALERPLLGWGPGASSWTFQRFFAPEPGLVPFGTVVTDSHSVALELGYELGGLGLVAVVAVVAAFSWRRYRELVLDDADSSLLVAALTAGAGLIFAACVSGLFDVSGPLVALLIVAGVALSARPRRTSGPPMAWKIGVLVATVVALGTLAPLQLAQRSYEAARSAADPALRLAALQRAVELDPSFPLYRLRLAVELAGRDDLRTVAASEATRAAEDAGELAPFWLAAGVLAFHAGQDSTALLQHACELDPYEALAPAYLWWSAQERAVPAVAARALALEPRLLSARFLGSAVPVTLQQAAVTIEQEGRIDAGWRVAFNELATTALSRLASPSPQESAAVELLELAIDGDGETSLSLFGFRRLPWPFSIGAIELDRAQLEAIDLASVVETPNLPRALFAENCRLDAVQP